MNRFMKKFCHALIAICVVLGSSYSAKAADDEWVIGIEKGIAKAEAEGKDIFLNFTGSDWCKFCIQLEGEVLGKKEFLDTASKDFVLVMVDFPTDKSNQSDELQKTNNVWKEKFSVSGYPTIALLDKKQRPYGFLGYKPGGPGPFLASLEELTEKRKKRDGFFEKAAKAKGLEKAKLLDSALSEMNEDLVTVYYEDVVNEIVELDKDNEVGLRNKYREAKFKELYKAVITDVTMISRLREPEVALGFIDEVLSEVELPPAYLLKVYQIKFDLFRRAKRVEDAEKLIDEMLQIDGVSDDPTLTQRLIIRKVYLLVGADRRPDAYKVLEEKIKGLTDNLYLYVAKGELLDSDGKYVEAVMSFDKAIGSAGGDPELMQTLHSAKADALFELKKFDDAAKVLNDYSTNDNWPADLRSDCLLHKAIILREQARIEKRPALKRAAIIAENKAIEIVETPKEKAERQKVVEKLRARYDKPKKDD